jgi:small GTP-binding protein
VFLKSRKKKASGGLTRLFDRVEDIFAKVLEVDGVSRALEIVDTAGQEEYKTLRDIYFKDSDGFVLVYAITSAQSFVQATKLKDHLTKIHGPGKPIILAGNKLDLESDRVVLEEEAYQYAVSQQVGFFECSAKNFVNVNELFSGVVRLIERQRSADAPAATASSAGGNSAGQGGTASEGGEEHNNNSTPQRGSLIKRCVIL